GWVDGTCWRAGAGATPCTGERAGTGCSGGQGRTRSWGGPGRTPATATRAPTAPATADRKRVVVPAYHRRVSSPEAVGVLGPVARAWFDEAFGAPTPAQDLAWPALAAGRNALVVAPTGSGKTLAAFLVFLDRLSREPRESEGVRVLYISPLRALGNDIHRNLDVPLDGMRALDPNVSITTGIRTGDTIQRDRNRLLR